MLRVTAVCHSILDCSVCLVSIGRISESWNLSGLQFGLLPLPDPSFGTNENTIGVVDIGTIDSICVSHGFNMVPMYTHVFTLMCPTWEWKWRMQMRMAMGIRAKQACQRII